MLKIIVISEALKKVWLAKGVPQKKLLVAHDGFNHYHFIQSKTQNDARETLGLPVDKKIVVYAGSLSKDRGVERIIALAKLFPDTFFVVVGGDENQKNYYKNLAKNTCVNNTLWTGYLPQTDVPAYLYAADVLIFLYTWALPHIKMLSPLKLFEYMAAGRIIVGEAFPTITEVLEHGKTAFLAEPADFASLCENLFQALNNDHAATMAEKARQQAFSKYTWENRAKDILSSIEGLLG